MENEIWKDIYYTDLLTGEVVDFRGIYQVSNFGRVKSLERNVKCGKGSKTVKEKILKNAHATGGYEKVWLRRGEKKKYYFIHRLVAYMFIPNGDVKKIQINHKDENKSNNYFENLEWCDSKYNNNYGGHNRRMSESKSKPVLGFKFEQNENYFLLDCVWGRGQSEIANKSNSHFKRDGINHCTRGFTKSHKGYQFCNFDLVNYLNESED